MTVESSRVFGVNLCSATTVSGYESQRKPKLEEKVTQLFDELRGSVYRYLLCLSMSSSEADEIVQEIFLRLYQHLIAGGKDDNLRGWVFRVAHNISINEIKRRKHAEEIRSKRWCDLTRSSGVDSAPSPEEALLRKETMARVQAAVLALSEQQKECLYLRAEGLRYREIAEILGVTVSTVAESLRRAIKKISKESHAETHCGPGR